MVVRIFAGQIINFATMANVSPSSIFNLWIRDGRGYAVDIDYKRPWTFITKRKEEHRENGPDGDDTNNIKGWNAPNLKQASIALRQGKSMIIAGLAESKKDHAIELLAKLKVGMDELHKIAEDRKREAVVPKQKELFQYVGG
nr:peptidyl-prolyl cis-trans isomerase CYP38, chloroplastic [Tanacetum cinerariifolium]